MFVRHLAFVGYSIVASLFVLLAFDFVLGLFYPQAIYPTYRIWPEPPVPPFGSAPDKKSYRHIKKDSSDEIIFDITYRFDQFNRRITPQPNTEKKKVALFFGGSNMFGEGVEENLTIPSYFAKLNPNYQVYNYAYRGYGPQQMLVKLRNNFESKEILSLSGDAFYLFYGFHVKRVVGTAQVIRWSQGKHPYFTLGESGKLIDKGYHSTARPLFNFFMWHLANKNLFRLLKLDFPKVTAKDYLTTCEIFKESYLLLKKKKINLKIIALQDLQEAKKIHSCINEKPRIILIKEVVKNLSSYQIPGDLHLNSLGASLVASRLKDHLGD